MVLIPFNKYLCYRQFPWSASHNVDIILAKLRENSFQNPTAFYLNQRKDVCTY